MMEIAEGLRLGLQGFFTTEIMITAFAGVLVGTMVGVLPGLGPVGAMVILMPFTQAMSVTQALVLMAAIYYGSMYGGSTTSILLSIPGEVASVVTAIDGYQMAKKGRAGAALAISAIGSFVAGTFGVIAVTLVAPALVVVALSFGPPEYAALMVLGLAFSAYLSGDSLLKGGVSTAMGLLIGTIGMDVISATPRFTFGLLEIWSGLEVTAVVLGLFGLGEVLATVRSPQKAQVIQPGLFDLRKLWPSREEFRRSIAPIGRGTLLGFIVGALPGAGAVISSFLSYAVERRLSKTPEKFGTGMIEAVAGPESANNAATSGAMIPLLSLGIPYSLVTAIMLSTMITHGVTPSPLLMIREPMLFWTVIVSMYVGNVVLLVLNLPLVGVWASLLKIPERWIVPIIMVAMFVGVFAANNRVWDLGLLVLFGTLGFAMRSLGYPAAPLVLAFILQPLFEKAVVQSLIISDGSLLIFLQRPISAVLIAIAFLGVLSPVLLQSIGGQKPDYSAED